MIVCNVPRIRLAGPVSAVLLLVSGGGEVGAQPEAVTALEREGQDLMRQGRFAQAAAKFAVLTRSAPDHALGWYNLAFAARRAGNCPQAVPAYRRYAELKPLASDPYFGLGFCLRDLGDVAGAKTALKKYLELERRPSEQRWVDKARGELAELEKRASETRAPLPLPAAASSSSPLSSSSTASSSVAAASSVAVRPSPSMSSSIASSSATSLLAQAKELRARGDLESAAQKCRAALNDNPELAEAHLLLGQTLSSLKRYEEAVQTFRRALERDPVASVVWYELAYALRKSEKLTDAVSAYERYSQLRPSDPDPYYGLGLTLRKLGRNDEALAALRKYVALEKRPESGKWIEKAKIEISELEKAAPAKQPPAPAQPALPSSPAPSPAPPAAPTPVPPVPAPSTKETESTASTSSSSGESQAKPPALTAPARGPSPEVIELHRRGMNSLTLRKYGDAVTAFEAAVRLSPENAETRYQLGVALALSGRLTDAGAAWAGALRVDPAHPQAGRGLRDVQSKLQKREADADLRALKRIFGVLRWYMPDYGFPTIYREIREMVLTELDYRKEAEAITTISANFRGRTDVLFPRVMTEYSTARVITTEWMDGVKAGDKARLDALGIDRRKTARLMVEAYCQQIFIDGVYHADPHPGNLLVRSQGAGAIGPSIVFLDFGATARVSENMRRGMVSFLQGAMTRDTPRIVQSMKEMGFISRRADPQVFDRVVEYFHDKFRSEVTVAGWSLKDIKFEPEKSVGSLLDLRGLNVSLSDLRDAFHIPKEWILLERTLLLLLGVCTTLDPEMNPTGIIQPYLEKFLLGEKKQWSDAVVEASREMALSALALPGEMKRFMDRALRGEIEVRFRNIEDSVRILHDASRQLLWGILSATSVVLAVVFDGRKQESALLAAEIAAACFGFGLISSLLAGRSRLRRHGRR